jgi:hypothetical protein
MTQEADDEPGFARGNPFARALRPPAGPAGPVKRAFGWLGSVLVALVFGAALLLPLVFAVELIRQGVMRGSVGMVIAGVLVALPYLMFVYRKLKRGRTPAPPG